MMRVGKLLHKLVQLLNIVKSDVTEISIENKYITT